MPIGFEAYSALLITDMLNDFVREEGSLQVPSAIGIVPFLEEILKEARDRGIPVIFLSDTHRKDDKEFRHWPPHAVENTWGGEVIEELRPRPEEHIVKKRRYSAFFGTDLDIMLRELGVSKIYLTGVLTNICILITAVDAVMHHYEVVVIRNGVASLSDEVDEFVLQQLEEVFKVEVT
ncbi:MAG: isochorismatase family cysteine hydrolase [Actinomycetota bacterium]|nr:isochorismatase family cysteine hydrolase [Actinomycetota bacterium]